MSCDEIYINRKTEWTETQTWNQFGVGQGSAAQSWWQEGRGAPRERRSTPCPGQEDQPASLQVPVGHTRPALWHHQGQRCSARGTGGPCQEGEDRDLPRRHPGTPDNTNATHLAGPPFPPVPTVRGFLPTFLTHTRAERSHTPMVTSDERQRHPHFPVPLHVLTDPQCGFPQVLRADFPCTKTWPKSRPLLLNPLRFPGKPLAIQRPREEGQEGGFSEPTPVHRETKARAGPPRHRPRHQFPCSGPEQDEPARPGGKI